jgi:hypothetical protein
MLADRRKGTRRAPYHSEFEVLVQFNTVLFGQMGNSPG